MFLPILKNTDLFDFQKTGNYNNYKLGMAVSPQDSYLTFNFKVASGGTLTVFNAIQITSINGDGTVTEGTTTDLLSSVPVVETSVNGYTHYEHEKDINAVLTSGMYYYYFSDGLFEMKSELFCIKNGFVISIYGLVFNIFNTTGYSGRIINDDSGNGLWFTLKNGRCLNLTTTTQLRYDAHLDLTGYSISNEGTAAVYISTAHKSIKVGSGTLFNLELTKVGSPTYHFPVIENGNYLFDENYNERITVLELNYNWTMQDFYFYLGGMDELTDNETGIVTYSPLNQFGATCYNAGCDFTNEFRGGVTYVLDYIIYEPFTKLYYKCSTPYTSALSFAEEIANWTAI